MEFGIFMEYQLCVMLGVGPVIWDNFCHQVRHVAFWDLNERLKAASQYLLWKHTYHNEKEKKKLNMAFSQEGHVNS